MTTNFKHIGINIAVPMLALFIAASCNSKEPKGNSQAQPVNKDTVNVVILKTDTAQKVISLPGNLLPNEVVQVRAKVQGYISTLKVDIGSKVSKGQVLALIDAPEINTRLQELTAKQKAAYSHYQSSKDYYDRIYSASKHNGVVAASELEKAKNQMFSDEADYKAAQFAVSSYRQIGNYLAIIAPYSGIITKRNVNVGSFVGNANELPLFEIENSNVLRLQVPVPEVYTDATLVGNKGELTTRSFPDKTFIATLVRKAGSIDDVTRSEIWEFQIPNHNLELKAGSYADVKLHFFRAKPSLVVPVSAVVTTLEKRFVIKVSEGKTQWVDVRNGFTMNDRQEIFGNLIAGDTIVLKGNEELADGHEIIIKKVK